MFGGCETGKKATSVIISQFSLPNLGRSRQGHDRGISPQNGLNYTTVVYLVGCWGRATNTFPWVVIIAKPDNTHTGRYSHSRGWL